VLDRGGPTITWLEALKNLGVETTREAEVATDPTSSATELSESSTQQGAKSAKRGDEGLLSLLALPHIRDLESLLPGQECRAKGNFLKNRPWLDILKGLVEGTIEEEKGQTNTSRPSVDEVPESLVHQGAKSAKSPPPSPEGDGTSGVDTPDVKPEQIRRPLVTTQDQLAEVMANLKVVGLVGLDLETTGLNPRKDSIRLFSLATKDATYIVDCQKVNPAGIFPILAERTLVAHNALFDLGFLSSLGFEVGKVADTMILSQLLYAGSKVEPLKREQTSHSLDSVVKRGLGLELDKTHQSGDWGGPLTPEMVEYAAKDVEVLLPLYEVLKSKVEEACLTHVAEIEH
jgi:hypothetical protein